MDFWNYSVFCFLFFFAAILDFTDVKNVTEGRRREGDQARFFMWIDFFSSLFCPVLQQSAVVCFNSVQVSRIPEFRDSSAVFPFFLVKKTTFDEAAKKTKESRERQRRLRSVSGFSLARPVRLSKQVNFWRMKRRGQESTVQYSTVQYSTVQYSTVQYSTVQCKKHDGGGGEGRGGEEGTSSGFYVDYNTHTCPMI